MKKLVYDPSISGKRMTIVCYVSGSGTNYREIVRQNRDNKYIVFTNRPDCSGVLLARENQHEVIMLSHIPYLKEARKRYGAGNVPRNCPERMAYEQEVSRLIESSIGGEPDLICLAGYDQWSTDWMVNRYYPRILNVHPGDTTRGYDGLHWVPSAKAILAGDESIRSTLFFVDAGEDTGPVLVQSRPIAIKETIVASESSGTPGLQEAFDKVTGFAAEQGITTYDRFREGASEELLEMMGHVCSVLQNELKEKGDWQIYPFAVHDLIAKGRVHVDDRTVSIDGKEIPEYGYRLD